MAAPFDTLTATDTLEAAGMDRRLARACAAQLQAAASAGEAVTRPELDAALTGLKAELLDRLAETERGLIERITKSGTAFIDRIVETERRMASLLWRLFGGIVAVAGLVEAAAPASSAASAAARSNRFDGAESSM